MRTKPIVLYSFCDLGNLAVAPGDSQRRARPARANLASEEAGAQIGPDLHFFLMLGTFLLFISHLFLLVLGDISGNFSILEVPSLW